jgi:hypothetical protein
MTHKEAAQLYQNLGIPTPAAIADTPKAHKYGATRKEVEGIVFASSLEARAYRILKLWERAGEISDLKLQPRFRLQFGFRDPASGKHHRHIDYVADFECMLPGGIRWVIDTKGFETPVFRLKMKLFRKLHGDIKFEVWDRAKVKELEGR